MRSRRRSPACCGCSCSARRSASSRAALRALGIDWNSAAQRRPGDAAGHHRRDVEADQLQLPVLPRRAAVDPAVADRGRGDRRRAARAGASGRSSSRCCRRPTFFLLVVNIVYAFFDTFGIIDAVTGGGPAKATEILVYKVYYDGVVGRDLGGSAAQSVILMVDRHRADRDPVPLRRAQGARTSMVETRRARLDLVAARDPDRSGVVLVAFPIYRRRFVASTLTCDRPSSTVPMPLCARDAAARELLSQRCSVGHGQGPAASRSRRCCSTASSWRSASPSARSRSRSSRPSPIVYLPLSAAHGVLLDDLRHADAAGRGAHHPDLQGRGRPAPDRHLCRASPCR